MKIKFCKNYFRKSTLVILGEWTGEIHLAKDFHYPVEISGICVEDKYFLPLNLSLWEVLYIAYKLSTKKVKITKKLLKIAEKSPYEPFNTITKSTLRKNFPEIRDFMFWKIKELLREYLNYEFGSNY